MNSFTIKKDDPIMKRLLSTLSAFLMTLYSFAQCDDIFFSEYVEGNGNNKALEIYNPTDQVIDLSNYKLKRYSNGDANANNNILQLQGSIQPYEVWVVANGQTDSVQLGGGGVSPPCSDSLQNMADQLDNNYPAPCYFNGNDALTIEKNNNIVDIFGKVSQDPGQAWTNDTSANFTDANGGTWLTLDHTLVRHNDVESGVKSNPSQFIVFAQWDTLPNQTWDRLGYHNCTCDTSFTSIDNSKPSVKSSLSIYPNPVDGDVVTIKSSSALRSLTIANLKGQIVYKAEGLGRAKNMMIPVSKLASNMYILTAETKNGTTHQDKLIIR